MANRVDFGDEPFDPPIGRIAGPVRLSGVELIVKNHPPLIGQINQRQHVLVAHARPAVDAQHRHGAVMLTTVFAIPHPATLDGDGAGLLRRSRLVHWALLSRI